MRAAGTAAAAPLISLNLGSPGQDRIKTWCKAQERTKWEKMWHPSFLTAAFLPSRATHRPWDAGACPTYIRLFKIPNFHCFSSSRLTVSLPRVRGETLIKQKAKWSSKIKKEKNVKQHWRQVVRTGPAPGDAWASSSPPTCLKCASRPTQQCQDIAASRKHERWLVSRKLSIFLS